MSKETHVSEAKVLVTPAGETVQAAERQGHAGAASRVLPKGLLGALHLVGSGRGGLRSKPLETVIAAIHVTRAMQKSKPWLSNEVIKLGSRIVFFRSLFLTTFLDGAENQTALRLSGCTQL